MQELERATGVNKSGLYTEFRDKEDFFVACLRHYLQSQQKRGLLTTEALGWNNVENFLKNGPLNKGSARYRRQSHSREDAYPETAVFARA